MKKENENQIKPKQYSHIDYEAILIYAMQHGVSIEKTLEENGINIARSTVVRNIEKIKKDSKGKNEIISIYQELYVPNMQKSQMPSNLKEKINSLPKKDVIIKNELEDLYDKLSKMKQIVESSNGNVAEAARRINEGTTILGNIKHITTQGLRKNMLRLEKVEKAMKQNELDDEER